MTQREIAWKSALVTASAETRSRKTALEGRIGRDPVEERRFRAALSVHSNLTWASARDGVSSRPAPQGLSP
jgi:hypothetical protein